MKAWAEFLKKQEIALGKGVFAQWLSPLKLIHFDAHNLYLEVKDTFQLLWFEEHIRPQLKVHLLSPNGKPIKVHLSISGASPPPTTTRPPLLELARDPLNPQMTLNRFIGGEESSALLRFLQELVDDRTRLSSINPIYLWGSAGSGKTHLLVALTHLFIAKGLNALYVRAETFTEHVVNAIRASSMNLCRQHYRQVDLLLIDDIHQLARKFATQEEFFHTFNTLHASARQIILTSRSPPHLLEEIEPRLISRFEWGITFHIEKLPSEALKTLLDRYCETLHFPLEPSVEAFLLERYPEGSSLYKALETLVLRSHLEAIQQIDVKTAERLLASLHHENRLTPDSIQKAVCSVYGISLSDLVGKSQTQECSLPRQVAMYLCRKELHFPFQRIGRLFDRDHSTVMSSVKHVATLVAEGERELLASLAEVQRHLSPT